MKKNYTIPEINMILVTQNDVITTSGLGDDEIGIPGNEIFG